MEQADRTLVVSGARIPVLGVGTWQLRDETCARIVAEALRLGYRHIDTAQGYENEAAVGEGLRASGVARDRVFITTKVRPELISDGALQRSLEESLGRLGVDAVDLALIHWPNPAVPVSEAMRALADAKRRGLTRHIGVSNFTVALLQEAVRASAEPLVTDQIEYHPYLDQQKLLGAIRQHGLAITAYCPLALGRVASDPLIHAVAAAHGRTPAQVALRWLIQQGDVIAIPKTANRERLRENFEVFGFALTPAEMTAIAALSERNLRLVNEPAWVPAWD